MVDRGGETHMDITWSFAVYLFCFVVGLFFAIASGFLGGVLHLGDGADAGGLDHDLSIGHDMDTGTDVSADHDVSVSHDASADSAADSVGMHLSPVSAPVLSTFLVGFGFAGMVGEMGLHLPWFLSAPSAMVFSFCIAILAFVAVGRFMEKSQGTSHVRFSDMIGVEAEVITPIPAEGVGEIAYTTPTGRTSSSARSETGALIPKHSMVTITKVVGNVAMVRETIDEQLRRLGREEHETTTEATPVETETEVEEI
jgi:membrane protein implicated in regulation of membrane protease activity